MNVTNRIIAVLVLSVAVCSCFAQGGGRGQRGRGGNGLAQLAGRADVQKDLELTADEITKLTELRQAQRQGGGGGGGTPPDPAARAARQAEQDKAVLAILTDSQQKRLKEIRIQIMGDTAVTLPEVQDALGFTDDQKAKVKDLQAKQTEANAAIMEKVRNQELDRAAAGEARSKNTQVLKDELHKLLTPEQVTKLKDLGGKPFVADTAGGGI